LQPTTPTPTRRPITLPWFRREGCEFVTASSVTGTRCCRDPQSRGRASLPLNSRFRVDGRERSGPIVGGVHAAAVAADGQGFGMPANVEGRDDGVVGGVEDPERLIAEIGYEDTR